MSTLAGRPYVFHVADPWPDFPIAIGAIRGRLPIAMARWLETMSYRGAALITTVSEGLVARLDANPAARGRVRLLLNGVDLDRFDPGADAAATRRALDWPDADLSLAYVGTIGLAQGVGTLISAMARLRSENVVLHLYGGGIERADLARRAEAEGLTRVIFHDPIPFDEVKAVLSAADAAVILLKGGPLYDASLPTKLVEGLAAGRPLIVSAGGDTARIVQGAGYTARQRTSTRLSTPSAPAKPILDVRCGAVLVAGSPRPPSIGRLWLARWRACSSRQSSPTGRTIESVRIGSLPADGSRDVRPAPSRGLARDPGVPGNCAGRPPRRRNGCADPAIS